MLDAVHDGERRQRLVNAKKYAYTPLWAELAAQRIDGPPTLQYAAEWLLTAWNLFQRVDGLKGTVS